LLLGTYLLYLGLTSSASVPLFGNIDWLHEAERLGAAQVILDGGLPIRDVYLAHGFLPEVIRPLAAFWLFGESLVSDRLMGVLHAPLPYVAAVFYIWRLFPTTFWRVAGLLSFALFPLLILPRHIVVFVTLAMLTGWVRDPDPQRLFRAGIIAGLGYVISTIDQATFLLAAVLALPAALGTEAALRRMVAGPEEPSTRPVPALFLETALPLYKGVLVGMLPFLAYLGVTGSATVFVNDLLRRGEADAFAFTHVMGLQSYPGLSMTNLLWYAIPVFYVGLMTWIVLRAARWGDRRWTAIWPTLLFGMVSFVYAVRHPTYWKLAVVAFPFIVGLVYLLSVLMEKPEQSLLHAGGRRGTGETVMAGLTGALMLLVLVHALTKDWKPQEIAPRYLFPVLAVMILAAAAMAVWGRLSSSQRHRLAVACPLAALVVFVWFIADAKPQVVSAQIKKPKLVGEAVRLAGVMASGPWRFSRDRPRYLEDDVLSYLKEKGQEGRQVVMLAVGAGIYYFHAGGAPAMRFPNVELAMADGWAREVVEALDRTRAELLVSCHDGGRVVTGWPMHPLLADFISSNYMDSGFRLHSMMMGDACPFSVWRRRNAGERAERKESPGPGAAVLDGGTGR
jgi:hypothetical protein